MALALGCFISDLDMMTADEYNQWRNYYNYEPFGFMRDNFHTAMICSNIAEFAGKALKKGESLPPMHFMAHQQEREEREPTVEESILSLKSVLS